MLEQLRELASGVTVEEALASNAGADGCFLYKQRFSQYYFSDSPEIDLIAAIATVSSEVVCVVLFQANDTLLADLLQHNITRPQPLMSWAAAHAVACFGLDAPLLMEPVHVPKPWGEEIWYTGIEARGQSRFMDACGHSVPIPWLLSLFPKRLANGLQRNITLLKILAPLPEPVFGDLYFEMHEKKQEVYVVTHVDARAWPSGQGGIRFGFCQTKRAQYANDDEFRSAYLKTVLQYEKIRREIDGRLDVCRTLERIGLSEPVPTAKIKAWLLSVPPALIAEEESARVALDSFAALKPLALGDVVKVPCFTPHSLLHGVTTVEFQTPVYERKILSFAQKVLTQNHWDTVSALKDVELGAPKDPVLPVLEDRCGVKREEIVCFDDFTVQRIALAPGASLALDQTDAYGLLMNISGDLRLGTTPFLVKQTRFLPAFKKPLELANVGDTAALLLFSSPRL